MPATTARIRAYSNRDEKEVRFMIGQAHMEPLAYANQHREIYLLRRAPSQSDAFY
jgi:hypothetical protein